MRTLVARLVYPLGFAACLTFVSPEPVYPQLQLSVFDINRLESVSARAAVLGGGYVSEAYDATVLVRNPAALGMLEEVSIAGGSSTDVESRVMAQNVAVSIPIGFLGTVGLGVSVAHAGHVRNTPLIPGDVRAIQYQVDIGYGYRITRTVGIGGRVGFRYFDALPYRLREIRPAFGAFYSPSPEVSYGLAYYDHGSPVQYLYNVDSVTGNYFAGYRSETPRQILQLGLTIRLRMWRREPAFVMTLVNQKAFGTSGISYKGGFELRPFSPLALRAGYVVDPDVAYGLYGAGVRVHWIEFDWAISPSRLSNRFHQVTFVVRF